MRSILFVCSLFICQTIFAQVNFASISFSEALAKARAEGKLVFLQFASAKCRECNEVADKGFSDKDLGETVNQSFIPLLIDSRHNDRKQIETDYNLAGGFGTLFIDPTGILIHKFSMTTSRPQLYKEQIDIALNKAGESMKLSELEKEYKNGNRTSGLLESLLLLKNSLSLNTTELLDEYVTLLPADSLTSVHSLQFIARLEPLIGSKADVRLRKDRSLFNATWYNIPPPLGSSINSRIILKSMKKAIAQKDESYAMRIASFSRGTFGANIEAGERAYLMHLLDFYKNVDDAPKYFAVADTYFENYFMRLDVDSIKQLDVATNKKLFNAAKKDTVKTEKGYQLRAAIRSSPSVQRYTNELAEGAAYFYKKTNDALLLEKATAWIKKALEFYETPYALDVYAHLLYKQAQKEEAIATETKAIELKKKLGFPVNDYEKALASMQSGLPVKD